MELSTLFVDILPILMHTKLIPGATLENRNVLRSKNNMS